MSQTYYAILTAIGEAKLANAAALNTTLKIAKMAVGDGGGAVPTPTRNQTALVGEWYRAGLNTLSVDPSNSSQIIAELVIPEATGGNWIREMGLYDSDGNLIAVANTPPSYKPQLAEGSGRTQVLRMILVVSSASAVELKIDPSVVLATREFVTSSMASAIADALGKLDAKNSVRLATTVSLAALGGLQSIDGVTLTKGDRVLVKNQQTTAENGLYLAAEDAWIRSLDGAGTALSVGAQITVESGKANADTTWQLLSSGIWIPISGITAIVTRNVDLSLNAALPLKHTWNNVQRDRQNLFDTTSQVFVAKWPGIYEVSGAVHLDSNGTTNTSFLHALVNGSLSSSRSKTGTGGAFSSLTAFTVSAKVALQTGDNIGLYSFLTATAKQVTFGDDDHDFFSITYRGEI